MCDEFATHSPSKLTAVTLPMPTLNRSYRRPLYLIAGRLARVAVGCVFTVAIGLMIFQLAGGRFIYTRERSAEAGPWAGSLLLARPVDPADVRVGDVLVISKEVGVGSGLLAAFLWRRTPQPLGGTRVLATKG